MDATRLTGAAFAQRVGVDYTTASRLRNGNRLPSLRLFARIVREFGLDSDFALAAFEKGPEVFGAFLRRYVFESREFANAA